MGTTRQKSSCRNRLQNGPRLLSRVKAGIHTRLRQQDRTQRLTRRNRGLPDGAAITTLGAFHTFRKPCVARCQNGKLCRFWVLVGGTPEGHREPAEQRCALMRVAVPRRRSPAGLRDLFSLLSKLWLVRPAFRAFRVYEAGVVSLPSARFACCRNAGRPLVKRATAYLDDLIP